ncbi:MAG: ABC transporter ATP-binding protein [Ignavibacteriales bacterium]|nr:ABC transporter ATP-binding protein [Ignavibacteriales bacterium]
MMTLAVQAKNLQKDFNRRTIFKGISFELGEQRSLVVTGKNGSGKSTLVKIVAGLLSATKGSVEYRTGNTNVSIDDIRDRIGFVSPYLNLYDEFDAVENIKVLSSIRSSSVPTDSAIQTMLERVGIAARARNLVRTYSSGMKQRLKYAVAAIHKPDLLILDEPTANLDEEGAAVVRSFVREQEERGILVVATNDPAEIRWGKIIVRL